MRRSLSTVLATFALFPLGLAAAAGQSGPAPQASASAAPKSTTVFLSPPPPMASVALGRTLPDPTALVSKEQWVYDLRYAAGDLYLLGIHHVELGAAQATPRAMGRFALELYEGATLLERARFDFPMMGDGAALVARPTGTPEAGTPLPLQGGGPSLTAKVSSRVGVMFPASPKGTRMDIVDRATDRRWPLPWPPTEMTAGAGASSPPAPTTDAGTSDGG